MKVFIELNGVTLDYALYSIRAKSLRNSVLNLAVGGKLMRANNDIAVVRAISNLNMRLDEGDRLAIVGHNGSGKTSLLKVLAGIYEPTAGAITMNGNISSMISMSIGLDMEASGIQNIKNLAMMQMMSNREIARRLPEIVAFTDLGPFIHMPFKTYSAGMMARLTFAVATSINADILIMDEWLGAGDADFQRKATERMTDMVGRAKIVVLATHNMDLAQAVSTKVLVMEAGRPVFFGKTADWVAQSAAA
jgi:lipopolysaccharide transport system ATP-binding protein